MERCLNVNVARPGRILALVVYLFCFIMCYLYVNTGILKFMNDCFVLVLSMFS